MKNQLRLKTVAIVFGYLLRSIAAFLVAFAALFFFVFPRWYRYDHNRYIEILAQIDLLRILFYGLALSAVFVLFFTLIIQYFSRTFKRSVFVLCLIFSAAAASIPYCAVTMQYRNIPWAFGWQIPFLYLAWNFFALFRWGSYKQWEDVTIRRTFRFVILSDLAVPAFVWACYKKRFGGWFIPFIILPFAFLGTLLFLPWVHDPAPLVDIGSKPVPWIRPILPNEDFYQVAFLPDDGSLLVSSFPNAVLKVDPGTGRVVSRGEAVPFFEHLQGFGSAPQSGEIVWVDMEMGRTYFMDKVGLSITRVSEIANPPRLEKKAPAVFASRTLWNPEAGMLFSFNFLSHTTQLSPEGDRVLQELLALPEYRHVSDGVIDAVRKTVHWVSWKGKLIEWDPVGLRTVKTYACASTPDRIVLDESGGRLFLPLPMIGKVEVVDANTYRRTDLIDSFLGVRVPMVSRETGRLYLAGLSPILEIRSLDDYSLIDRVFAPPWMRWGVVDDKQKKAFLTGIGGGLFSLDLEYLEADARGAFYRRNDPFIPLVTRLARLANALAPLPKVFIPSVREQN